VLERWCANTDPAARLYDESRQYMAGRMDWAFPSERAWRRIHIWRRIG
jgi:hypothetical protein